MTRGEKIARLEEENAALFDTLDELSKACNAAMGHTFRIPEERLSNAIQKAKKLIKKGKFTCQAS